MGHRSASLGFHEPFGIDLVQTERFDTFIVDTFPRGLGGELAPILPELSCRKLLAHRDLNPRYCDQYKLKEFVQHYEQLLVPGESAPFDSLPHAVLTEPWLIRDQHELLFPTQARRMLKVDSDSMPVVVVIGCGRTSEVEQMRSLAMTLTREFTSAATVRFVTLSHSTGEHSAHNSPSGLTTLSFWSFFQAIRGVSIIVGSGGYNSVNEVRATQTKFIGLSWPKLYDRQQRRLNDTERATNFQRAREQVAAAIASHSRKPPSSPPRYRNGVHPAIKTINTLDA